MATTKAKQPSNDLYAFRVIVRGTQGAGKNARRVRRVFTTPARDEGAAVELAQPRIEKACKGLDDLYVAVLPPLGKAA